MFKAGERVWHIWFGWGVLEESSNDVYPLSFRSDTGVLSGTFNNDGKEHISNINPTIFYKEQTFDTSKPEPAIGTWGYFWDDEDSAAVAFSQLSKIIASQAKYATIIGLSWTHFSTEIPPHIKELMNGTDTSNP